MSVLTKAYFAENKWLALTGGGFGFGTAAVVHFLPLAALAAPIGLGLLNFPYIAKTPAERMLRLGLIGFYLSLALVYSGRQHLPLTIIGTMGSAAFGAGLLCLRHRPPAAEPSELI